MPLLDETEIQLIQKVSQKFGQGTDQNRRGIQKAYIFARNTAQAWLGETVEITDVERTVLYLQRKITGDKEQELSFVNSCQEALFGNFCFEFACCEFEATNRIERLHKNGSDCMLACFLDLDLFENNQLMGWLLWAIYSVYSSNTDSNSWPLQLPNLELLAT